MRLIALGDIHLDPAMAAAIPDIGQAELVVVTGDLTNFGGRDQAAEVMDRLRTINPRLRAVAGNLDRPEVAAYLAELGISLHGRGEHFGHLGLFGVGGSNPTPFATPNEFSEEELARLLERGYQQVADARWRILVSHPPPRFTRVDRLANGGQAGSSAVRAFIERRQPDLCLCGHIHEAAGKDRIGSTLILNPGMISQGGYVEVRVTPERIQARLEHLHNPTDRQQHEPFPP